MTRPRYSSRPGQRDNRGARAYRGVETPTKTVELPVVPVTGELVECPGCHGGVKETYAPGRWGKGPMVYASHRFGGSPSRGWSNRCPMSLEEIA